MSRTIELENQFRARVRILGFNSFKSRWNFNLTNSEREIFKSMCDTFIENDTRRRRGDFYTPEVWVNEAHKLLEKHLGSDWKDNYVVWDCCCGTKNLTADRKFKNLYCSTLSKGDLDISQDRNRGSLAFVYDFLNDDVELFERYVETRDVRDLTDSVLFDATYKVVSKDIFDTYIVKVNRAGEYRVSDLLESLVRGDKFVFLINPPYGAGSDIKSVNNGNKGKSGIGFTNVWNLMEQSKIKGRRNIYIQFMYRIYLFRRIFNTEVVIGLFSPSSVMNNDMSSDIRMLLYSCGNAIKDSFMIQASNFADVADNWGITFTVWSGDKNCYTTDVLEYTDGEVIKVCEHRLQQIDKSARAIDWVKSDKKYKKIPAIVQTSAIKTHEKTRDIDENSLCQFMCNMNIVESNLQKVTLINGLTNANWAIIGVHEENYNKVMSYFTARKLVIPTWINWQDEYMVPNIEHPLYSQWEKDCIVYSLFNSKSNQSSLRGIDYNGKTWNIYNEFFYLTREQVKNRVANPMDRDNINPAIEDDLRLHGEKDRFVALKLEEIYDDLSSDAREVLDYARELTLEMYHRDYRDFFNADHPEYHINTWDAGWYQVKGMLKEYKPDELKKFDSLYKSFSDRLRPLVYELGFLKK